MKWLIASLLIVTVMFTGCTKTVYVYNDPKYPEMRKLEKVSELPNSYIFKKCLFIDDRNTSLCGNDLNKVITQVKKLRVNESTCDAMVDVYNEFIETQKTQPKKDTEYNFGF